MNKIKGIIIAVVVLLVYGLIMYFVFGSNATQSTSPNDKSDNTKKMYNGEYYMVVGNNDVFRYVNGSFTKSRKSYIEALSDMKVYIDNKYLGNYKLSYVSSWNLLNEKSEFVKYDGELIAISNPFNVFVRDIKVREINDDDKYLLINNCGITSFKNLNMNNAIDVDLDKNGEMDKIISVSVIDEYGVIDNNYSIVLLKYNGNVIKLIDERKEEALYHYGVLSVINVFDDSNDSIVLSKMDGYSSEDDNTSTLFVSYKNNNYVID